MFTSKRRFIVKIEGYFFSAGEEIEEVMDKVKEHIRLMKEVSTCTSPPSSFTSLCVSKVDVEEYKNGLL